MSERTATGFVLKLKNGCRRNTCSYSGISITEVHKVSPGPGLFEMESVIGKRVAGTAMDVPLSFLNNESAKLPGKESTSVWAVADTVIDKTNAINKTKRSK